MTNETEAFIHFHSFSAFCPILTSFCLIGCLLNAGPPAKVKAEKYTRQKHKKK